MTKVNLPHPAQISHESIECTSAERPELAYSVEKLPASALSNVFRGALPLPACEIVDPGAI